MASSERASKRLKVTPGFSELACGKATHAAARRKGRAKGAGSEDRYAVESLAVASEAESKTWFAAVYDGHGGPEAAALAAEKLHTNLVDLLSPPHDPRFTTGMSCLSAEMDTAPDGAVDDRVKHAMDAIVTAFRMTDDQILDGGIECGSTACVAVFGRVAFICANAGDSRAVLCRKPAPPVAPPSNDGNDGDATTDAAPGNTSLSAAAATAGAAAPTAAKDWEGTARSSAIRLTTDHKPTLTSERERIVAAGGMVLTVGGVPRVCSENSPCMLAVSRALGNRSLKFGGSVPRGLITEVPDCSYHPYDGSELLVVLMSDGVSDVLEDQAISDVALEAALAAGAATPEEAADAAAEAVVRRARDLRSPDDITAVVVILSEDAWKGGLIEAPTPPLNLDYEEVDTA
eukprot:m.445111 g.445111  ORF g.445111 m.445111 type:complete len:403 (+) comp19187_c0_seq1:203-1411(+)